MTPECSQSKCLCLPLGFMAATKKSIRTECVGATIAAGQLRHRQSEGCENPMSRHPGSDREAAGCTHDCVPRMPLQSKRKHLGNGCDQEPEHEAP